VRTTVSVPKKLRAGAAARSRSSASAASHAKRTLQGVLLPLRLRRARHSGTSLRAPNTTIIIVAEIPPKIALRPSNVRAAASTLRQRGSSSPCGSVVRTPPRAGKVPRDALRRRGIDRSAILYERPRGGHEDCICIFLYDLTRVLLLFSGFPGPIFNPTY